MQEKNVKTGTIPWHRVCQWFLRCREAATTTEPHPILGDVPICQGCHDKLRRIEDS